MRTLPPVNLCLHLDEWFIVSAPRVWNTYLVTRYANGTVSMSLRLIQALVLLGLAACSASPSRSAQSTGDRPFTVTEVARFDAPWAMDFLPGSGVPRTNMALVTEKAGKLWLLDVGTGQKTEIAGVPAVHVEGQGGLADVVASPDFAGNQRIYLSFPDHRATCSQKRR